VRKALPQPEDAIPHQFFTAISYLIPRLSILSEETCGLNVVEMLVLLHLSASGKRDEYDRPTVLRNDLTKLLGRGGLLGDRGFANPSVTKLLEALQRKKFVHRRLLDSDERNKIFGNAGGKKFKFTVSLTPEGSETILAFRRVLGEKYLYWYANQKTFIRAGLEQLKKKGLPFVEHLIEEQKRIAREKLTHGSADDEHEDEDTDGHCE